MNKILTTFLVLLLGLSAFAQVDIKSFNKIGPEACLVKLRSLGINTSNLEWSKGGEDGHLYLEDKDGDALETSIVIRDKTYELVYFQTSTMKFIFLSDYIDGGLKVGDTVSKATNFDFSKTAYGRGNKKNNCTKKTEAGETFYIIFSETPQVVEFETSNGKISWICFDTLDSELPSNDNDPIDIF